MLCTVSITMHWAFVPLATSSMWERAAAPRGSFSSVDITAWYSQENELLECKSCDISFLHYVVQFKYGEGHYFLSQTKCEKCSGLLKAAQKELSEYSCKSCGNALLESEVEGIWD